jgi:predicted RNA binding protein YcfA (HicA-like mRNA interferase family)
MSSGFFDGRLLPGVTTEAKAQFFHDVTVFDGYLISDREGAGSATAYRIGPRARALPEHPSDWGLCRLGFQLHHVTGSDHVLRSALGRQMTEPVHAGGVIGPGLLKRITEQAGVTVQQLREQL